MVRAGETYDDCLFVDCIVQNVPEKGARTFRNSEFVDCTFIGQWPPEFRNEWLPRAVRSDEREVVEARAGKSIRPAPRQRRSIFNWRKRD